MVEVDMLVDDGLIVDVLFGVWLTFGSWIGWDLAISDEAIIEVIETFQK